VVIGGLLSATTLTLIVLPALYARFSSIGVDSQLKDTGPKLQRIHLRLSEPE
jgi:hypothetical protein